MKSYFSGRKVSGFINFSRASINKGGLKQEIALAKHSDVNSILDLNKMIKFDPKKYTINGFYIFNIIISFLSKGCYN